MNKAVKSSRKQVAQLSAQRMQVLRRGSQGLAEHPFITSARLRRQQVRPADSSQEVAS